MSYNVELNGLEKLKNGSLYSVFAAFLFFVVLVLFIAAATVMGTFGTSSFSSYPNSAALSIAGIGIIILIIAVIFSILSIINLRSGFSLLSSVSQNVGVGKTGTTLWILTIISAILLSIPLAIALGPGGVILVEIIVGILSIVANILIGIGFYNVGNLYKSTSTKVGGILIAIPLIPFIGFILTYIGMGEIIRKVRSGVSLMQGLSPQPVNAPIVIYQSQPSGTISPNGVLTFQVYSNVLAQLLSATIEGLNVSTSSFNPQIIQPNQPVNVVAYFNPLPITQGVMYRVIVTASAGGTIIRFTVNAVGTQS